MNTFKTFQYFVVSISILMMTACGNSESNSVEIATTKQIAINKIIDFALSGENIPTRSDYRNAGVSGVTSKNIDKINEEIAKLDQKDVDTQE